MADDRAVDYNHSCCRHEFREKDHSVGSGVTITISGKRIVPRISEDE